MCIEVAQRIWEAGINVTGRWWWWLVVGDGLDSLPHARKEARQENRETWGIKNVKNTYYGETFITRMMNL